jgi:hypothetical protein
MKKYWIDALLFIFLVACGGGAQLMFGAHSVTLTWTPPVNQPAGSYINIYRGTAAGAESGTPLNPAHIATTTTTFQDDNVQGNAKYYYTAKQCAVDLSTNAEVCSAPSNEASATVPLVSGDLSTVVSLGAVGK